jgi:hypothetical protein
VLICASLVHAGGGCVHALEEKPNACLQDISLVLQQLSNPGLLSSPPAHSAESRPACGKGTDGKDGVCSEIALLTCLICSHFTVFHLDTTVFAF